MENKMKSLFRTGMLLSFFISGGLLTGYLFIRSGQLSTNNDKKDIIVDKLGKSVISTSKIAKGVDSTIKKLLMEDKFNTDTAKVYPDTVKIAVRFEQFKIASADNYNKLQQKLGELQDSIKRLQENLSSAKKLSTNNHYIYRDISDKSIIDSNANVYVVPITLFKRNSLLSSQRNYLRVLNRVSGGQVNNQPYFDYEENIEPHNQLLFQLREGYGINNKILSLGIGTELKINRFGFGINEFYSPTNNKFTTTLSSRYDLYRILFK